MSKNLIAITFNVERDVEMALRQAAKENERTLSAEIRLAVRKHLKAIA